MYFLNRLSSCHIGHAVIWYIIVGFIDLNIVCPSLFATAVPPDNIAKHRPDPLVPLSPIRHDHLVLAGKSINLTCPYDTPFYYWTKVDESQSLSSDKRWVLIPVAKPEHSGLYRCQAIYGHGSTSAEMAVRVVDPNSYLTQQECATDQKRILNPEGPCFLKSYSDYDLKLIREWGDSITLDCDAVTGTAVLNKLKYQWRLIRNQPVDHIPSVPNHPTLLLNKPRILIRSSESDLPSSPPLPHSDLPHLTRQATHGIENIDEYVDTFIGPKLKISKLDLSHTADYQCVVTTNAAELVPASTISRMFQLTVKPRTEGKIILGPSTTNQTVVTGDYASFTCEINPKEHRSSTIRWGKSIKISERSNHDTSGREVIQWAGGTFVVLPTIRHPSNLLGRSDDKSGDGRERFQNLMNNLPSSNIFATESTTSQSSQLILPKAQPKDSGRYVCSVLTEDGRDGHKFVHITVVGSGGETRRIANSKMRRLTVYIAVPTIIFFVCLCMVTYCLITRRTSRASRRSHRSGSRGYYGPNQISSQIKAPSAASSSSVGMNRNGMSQFGPPTWNTNVDPRASVPGTVVHSSTNGSNSLSGTAPLLLQPNQIYQPPTNPIQTSTYPIFYPPNQTPFYTVPDPNNPHGYILSTNPPGSNEMSKPTYPVNYSLPNGHSISQNTHSMTASSPDSSAVVGMNETFDGRLVYQPSQSSGSNLYQINQPGGNRTTSNLAPNSSGYHGPTPLIAQNHTHNPEFEMTPTASVGIGPPHHHHQQQQQQQS